MNRTAIGMAIMTMGCSTAQVSVPGLPGGEQYRAIQGDELRMLIADRKIEPAAGIEIHDSSLAFVFRSDGTFQRGGRTPVIGQWEIQGATYCTQISNRGWSCLPMYIDRSGTYFTQSKLFAIFGDEGSYYPIKITRVEN